MQLTQQTRLNESHLRLSYGATFDVTLPSWAGRLDIQHVDRVLP